MQYYLGGDIDSGSTKYVSVMYISPCSKTYTPPEFLGAGITRRPVYLLIDEDSQGTLKIRKINSCRKHDRIQSALEERFGKAAA